MFVPYSTDAPVYHWPVATVGLILINIIIFVLMVVYTLAPGHFDLIAIDPNGWVLVFGDGLHSGQWLLNNFAHADIEHLFGNMMFLWVFGLVVEGKLGWQRFIPIYLLISIAYGMIIQILMLGYEGPGYALGASAAIYGLMAMAAVWAPKNDITFGYWFGLFMGSFEVPILGLAAFYIGLDLLVTLFMSGAMSSSLLHMTGALLGFPLGIILLKKGIVDCEGWDMFHVWNGDYGTFKKEPEVKPLTQQERETLSVKKSQVLVGAKEQIATYLQNGNLDAAWKLHEKVKVVGKGVELQRNDLLRMIKALHATQRWRDSAPFMAELVTRYPEGSEPVRIKLAQICIMELSRPGKALDLLEAMSIGSLAPDHQKLARKLMAKAIEMQEEGIVEVDSEEW